MINIFHFFKKPFPYSRKRRQMVVITGKVFNVCFYHHPDDIRDEYKSFKMNVI